MMVTNLNNPILAKAAGDSAGSYVLLEPSILEPSELSPQNTDQVVTFTDYIQGLYVIFFIVVMVSAIIMLVYYGTAYMFSVKTDYKTAAKKRLTNILWGVFIAFISWLILNQINPCLAGNLRLNIFSKDPTEICHNL